MSLTYKILKSSDELVYLKVLGWRRDGSIVTYSLFEDPNEFFGVLVGKGVKFSNSLCSTR